MRKRCLSVLALLPALGLFAAQTAFYPEPQDTKALDLMTLP
jgi:hypothetical protein